MSDPANRPGDAAAGKPAATGSPTILERYLAEAVARHRDEAAFIRLVAAELPPREQPPWLAVADTLATGDFHRGLAAATTGIACWIPLFASPRADPRLPTRLLQTAARRPHVAEARWLLLAYPLAISVLALGLLGFLSATVMTAFEALFQQFGMELPLATRAALAIRPFMASIWEPLFVVAGLVGLTWWLAVRWSAGSSVSTASFTRTLARLIAAEIPTDEAVLLAGRVVAAPALDRARPRRPLSFAAAAALDFAPRTAAILLDAVADCHDDRARGSLSLSQWFVGPVLLGVVGLLVGFITVALFFPLLNLVGALS